jgi:AsmA protein
MSFEVQAIVVDDASVTWTDAVTGANWQLSDFNVELEDFGPDTAFPMRMSFALTGTDLAIDLSAEMQATLGLADNDYFFEDLTVDIDGRGAAWPGGESALSVSFDALAADLDAETVELRGFALEFLDVNVNGNLSGRQLFSDLSLAGRVDIDAFDPQDLLEALGIELETADSDVLRSASATAELAYGPNQMMLQNMTLQLDDSELVGALGMRGETLSFDLVIDAINVDRYMPPAEEAPADDEGSLDEVDLPLDALRSFNAAGNMRVGQFQFNGLSFADFVLQVAASDGRVRLTPSASLYGGSYAGTIGMDVQQSAATVTLQQQLELVDVAPLLRDLVELETFTGTLDLEMDVVATGANMGEVMRQLDGDVSFAMTDGAWEGVDMWYEMRRARALARQETAPARPAGVARTEFSRIAASGVIEDAVLTNNDFTAGFGFMTVAGAGTVELLNDVVDFDVTARFVDGELLQSDPLMADLAGDELPLRVTGSLAAPTVRPDFGALVRARAQEAVEERVEEEREQIQERVQDRLRGLFDR